MEDFKVHFSAFIQFKTLYNIKEMFEDVDINIQVTVCHNHSMILTNSCSYIGRAHPVFSLKQNYENILKKCYEDEYLDTVEINIRKSYIGDDIQALVTYVDREKVDQVKELFVQKHKELISNGVYLVPFGSYANLYSLNYKINMKEYQVQLNSVETKSILLYEFKCDQKVYRCEFDRTIKEHLMMLKSKNDLPMFLAVKFVKQVEGTSRGMVHFRPENEAEVLNLLECIDFWNKVKIMQPSMKKKKMFNYLPPTAVECKENWNYIDIPVEEVMQDMVKINEVKVEK